MQQYFFNGNFKQIPAVSERRQLQCLTMNYCPQWAKEMIPELRSGDEVYLIVSKKTNRLYIVP